MNEKDIELFRQSVGKVKRIENDKSDAGKPSPKPIPKQLHNDEKAVIREMLSEHYDPASLNQADEISFHRPGIQQRVLRKLKRGQYSVAAELDLHGLTVPEARQALVEFLHHARHQQKNCVRIIHGKGQRSSNKGPVLKPMVAKWLTQLDEVLAYCTSRPADGGTGAVYVLLKK